MNARVLDQVHAAPLAHAADDAQGAAQRLAHGLRRWRRRDEELGDLGARDVRADVGNELALLWRQLAQLQSASWECKERVVLRQIKRPLVDERARASLDHGEIGDARFDLDVSSHADAPNDAADPDGAPREQLASRPRSSVNDRAPAKSYHELSDGNLAAPRPERAPDALGRERQV